MTPPRIEGCANRCEKFSTATVASSFVDLYWIVWTCLLVPGETANDVPPHQLVKQWDEANPGDADITLLYGLVLYRRGEYAAALERFTECQRLSELSPPRIVSAIYLLPLRAMACHRLGQIEEAKNWLSKTKAAIDEERAKCLAQDNPAEFPWHRCATVLVLLKEAEHVLSE